MKIGITYDLRDDYLAEGYGEEETAEFDHPLTIAAIEEALRNRSVTRRTGSATSGRWPGASSRATGGISSSTSPRGSGVSAARRRSRPSWTPMIFPTPFPIRWCLSLTLHKGMTKRVIRDLGIPTPGFRRRRDAGGDRRRGAPLSALRQTGRGGNGERGHRRLEDRGPDGTRARLPSNLLATFRQPVLVETFLPGREFTVGIIGTGAEAFAPGVMEVHLTEKAEKEVYSYVNKEDWHGRIEYRLAADAMARAAEKDGARRLAGPRLPRRGEDRPARRRRRDAQLHRGEPPGRPPSRTLGSADPLRARRDALPGADRRDHALRPETHPERIMKVAVIHGEVAAGAGRDETGCPHAGRFRLPGSCRAGP